VTTKSYVCSKCDKKNISFDIAKGSDGYVFNVRCIDCGHGGIIKNTHKKDEAIGRQTVSQWLSDYSRPRMSSV